MGLKHWGWVVLFGSCFSVVLLVVRSSGFVLLVVLFVVRSSVRAFGRSFRGSFLGFVLLVVLFVVRALGSCFLVVLFVVRALGSCFWSFFSWFVLGVRASGRSFCGSFFWGLVCVFCSML